MTDILPRDDLLPEGWVEIEMTETGWRPLGAMPYEQWEASAVQLQRVGRAWQWWIGDLILYGERHYGETYIQAIDLTGMEKQTLMNVVSVARRVETSRRRENVSWSSHEAVAALPPDEQAEWLDRAAEKQMTVERLRTAIRSGRDPGPAPDEPFLPTHRATITFLLPAESDDAAHIAVKAFADLLSKRGAQVTHKHAERIGR